MVYELERVLRVCNSFLCSILLDCLTNYTICLPAISSESVLPFVTLSFICCLLLISDYLKCISKYDWSLIHCVCPYICVFVFYCEQCLYE